MENNESVEDGAQRELFEESVATVTLGPLLAVLSVPYISQVHMMYFGTMTEAKFEITPESTEINLYRESEIPWSELAFRTVKTALEHYFECRNSGVFVVKCATLE
jgi:ADP-ribose pyrophosphatase YjhB (NUDIX family)